SRFPRSLGCECRQPLKVPNESTPGLLPGARHPIFLPLFRQPKQLCLRHLDQCQHLFALGNNGGISWTGDAETTPEPNPLDSIEPALDVQPITELGGPSVIDLGPNDHWIPASLSHLGQRQSE